MTRHSGGAFSPYPQLALASLERRSESLDSSIRIIIGRAAKGAWGDGKFTTCWWYAFARIGNWETERRRPDELIGQFFLFFLSTTKDVRHEGQGASCRSLLSFYSYRSPFSLASGRQSRISCYKLHGSERLDAPGGMPEERRVTRCWYVFFFYLTTAICGSWSVL